MPKLSEAMQHLGDAYENDIPFAKRYVIDKSITPLTMHNIRARKEGKADPRIDRADRIKGARAAKRDVL